MLLGNFEISPRYQQIWIAISEVNTSLVLEFQQPEPMTSESLKNNLVLNCLIWNSAEAHLFDH